MRWFIIRTIWFREMRDQLRDRRTLFMILGLPLVLYPLLGFAVLQFAVGFTEKPSVIGVVVGPSERKDFPPRQPPQAGRSVAPVLAWLSATPVSGFDLGACALAQASHLHLDYPLLIEAGYLTTFDSRFTPKQARAAASSANLQFVFLEKLDPDWQNERKLELILEAPTDFFTQLEKAGDAGETPRPTVDVYLRQDGHRSRLALRRLSPLLDAWKHDLRKVRLARKGLTEQYLEPFEVRQPDERTGGGAQENAISLVVRIFPLFLVMWSLSGALYPAVDLCAGEKERGTMETLLITPAGREEIVLGKFLTIWVFSSSTALLNLLSMGITTSLLSSYMPQGGISIAALLWCVVLSLPQSAFFSALGLAIGAYARSSKEGQYYLMPLFVLTMPLIFLTLVPGVELNPFYSMIPVTGVALLMQRLMTATNLSQIPWGYFVPVLAPVALYSWLALRWAIEQFNREEVLFREAERLDVLLWLKRLFREKEPVPTTGQAFFCLAVLIGLRWLTMGMGNRWSLEMHTAISQLAFVAMPPLFMIMLLNTQPTEGLYLHWPRRRVAGLAALLAVLLLPPMTGLTQYVAVWFPDLLLEETHPLIKILVDIHKGRDLTTPQLLMYLLAFALVPALCEEIAFRGFVLRGLHHGFRPRNAVLLSSFFFALFHLNVFLFVPTFVLGVILGLLTVRSRSLLPAISFHLLHNSVLIAMIPLSRYSEGVLPGLLHDAWPWLIGLCVAAAAALVWWLYRKPYADLARQEAAEEAASRQQAAGSGERAE
jgi:sodium transport system permease protein